MNFSGSSDEVQEDKTSNPKLIMNRNMENIFMIEIFTGKDTPIPSN